MNKPRLVDASAFISVDTIGKIEITAWNNSLGTTISSCAFSNYLSVLTISDEDLTYHEFVTKEITINLIGSKWTFD